MSCLDGSCYNGTVIKIIEWRLDKIPKDTTSRVAPFVQGDEFTDILRVVLDPLCGDFSGLTLDALIQVPNTANDILDLHTTIDENNTANFILPVEALWYPGEYKANFMFTNGPQEVKWSGEVVTYSVSANINTTQAPSIVPGEEQKYLDLIADLNRENTDAVANLPLLEAENDEAEQHIIDLTALNAEATQLELDLTAANNEATQNIADLNTENSEAVQNIADLNTAIGQVPGLIQDINDAGAANIAAVEQEGNDQVLRVQNQGTTEVNDVIAEGDTQVTRVTNEGNTQVAAVINQGNIQVSRVTNEGTTQVTRLINEGTTQVNRVQTVADDTVDRIEEIIENNPDSGNAAFLNGHDSGYFDEQIDDNRQNKAYILDPRLVYAFIPGQRNLENLKHGVYVKNPLTNGDGTIWSEDDDSIAGVFDDENKSFYCGGGYENVFSNSSKTELGLTSTFEDDIYYITTGNDNNVKLFYDLGSNYNDGETLTVTWDFIKGFVEGITSYTSIYIDSSLNDGSTIRINEEKNSFTFVVDKSTGNNGIGIWVTGDIINHEIQLKLQTTKTSQPVPHIKDASPDGKLIIKEPWTIADYTIINLDENYQEQEFFIDSTGINLHLKNDGIARNEYISNSLIYKGVLTQAEKDNEILKASSGKLYVPNAGVYEPVQGAKKRANEYGETKNFRMIESSSTDIQLVETDKLVTTTAYDGTIRVDRILSDGSIVPVGTGGGIEDIGGYIRLTAVTNPSANTPVKVTIEKVVI